MHQRAGVQQLERGTGPGERTLVHPVGAHRAVAPPAEGRPEPLAALGRGPRLGEQPDGVRAQRAQPGLLAGEELVEALALHGGAERVAVPGRGAGIRGTGRGGGGRHLARLASGRSVPRAWPEPRIAGMSPARPARIRRAPGRRPPELLLRVLPAQGRGGGAGALVALDQRARAVAPDVRLGHLRRRRLHPRPHGGDHRPDPGETSLLPMAHLTCVGAHPGRDHRRSSTSARRGRAQRAGPARRPAHRPRDGVGRGRSAHASELVAQVRAEHEDLCVGVAAFPEGPPRRGEPRGRSRGCSAPSTTRARSSPSRTWCCAPRTTSALVQRARDAGRRLPDHPRHHADPEPSPHRPHGGTVRVRTAAGGRGRICSRPRTIRPRSGTTGSDRHPAV